MMHIDPQTGFTEARGRSPRFNLWTAFFLFSIIVLASSVQVRNQELYDYGEVPTSAKYAVACASLTFVATLAVVILHFIPTAAALFVGTQIEGTVIVIMVVFWTAIVAIESDASNGLMSADDPSNVVQNANLYYFSWAGFFTAIFLAIEYCRSVFSVDAAGALRNRASRLDLWSGFLGTAVVIMGSASRALRNDCNGDLYREQSESYCARTRFAVAIGTIGVMASIGIIVCKVTLYGAPLNIETATAFALGILNTAGVAFITSPAGPGSSIGNLYYFSWGSFLLSAFLVFHCFGELTGHNESNPTVPSDPSTSNQPNGTQEKDNRGDIEVETFEDGM